MVVSCLIVSSPCAFAQQRVAAEESPAASGVPAEPVLTRDRPDGSAEDKPKPAGRKNKVARKWARASKVKPANQARPRVQRRREREPSQEYRRLRDSWHAPVQPEAVPVLEVTGRVPLVLSRVNGGTPVTIVPQREDGGFSEQDQARAARAFCSPDAKHTHAIAPRLLDLVYRTMRYFEAPLVHVVSGYRRDRAGSRHTQGRAIDMVIPGVTNEELAAYARTFGFVGVGIYPKSGFVHLDVREHSYFWVDNSMPGERSRPVPHLIEQATASDVQARGRGEAPDVFVPNNEREDRAAARSYARRARLRRARAERERVKAEQQRNARAAATETSTGAITASD
jgi:hypothetical protein